MTERYPFGIVIGKSQKVSWVCSFYPSHVGILSCIRPLLLLPLNNPRLCGLFPCKRNDFLTGFMLLNASNIHRMRNLPVSAKDGSSSEHNLLTLGMKLAGLVACLFCNAKVSNWKSIKYIQIPKNLESWGKKPPVRLGLSISTIDYRIF